MKRSTPLKRSGFASQWRLKVEVIEVDRPERPRPTLYRVPVLSARIFKPQPKFEYVRSEAMRLACRALPCQCCGIDNGTVVWAHSNWAIHGHGRGIKASDQFVASLCALCHGELDQGMRLTESARQSLWWLAHVETVRKLVGLGLWPVGVPVPDTSEFPQEWIPLE